MCSSPHLAFQWLPVMIASRNHLEAKNYSHLLLSKVCSWRKVVPVASNERFACLRIEGLILLRPTLQGGHIIWIVRCAPAWHAACCELQWGQREGKRVYSGPLCLGICSPAFVCVTVFIFARDGVFVCLHAVSTECVELKLAEVGRLSVEASFRLSSITRPLGQALVLQSACQDASSDPRPPVLVGGTAQR